jgi:hypothetical protein
MNESKEEAHYWFTVLAIVELMNEQGQSKVMNDIMSCALAQRRGPNDEGDIA